MIPNDIIQFWLGVGEKKWYAVDPKLDAEIRERFEKPWREARAGKLSGWENTAEGALALLILTDQFSRNMFRGKADAFPPMLWRARWRGGLWSGDMIWRSLPMRGLFSICR